MKKLTGIFLKGLAAVLPLVITIYAITWLAVTCETQLKGLLLKILPDQQYYFPGLGTILGIGMIFIIGLILNAWIAQFLWNQMERLVQRLPLIHTIYGSIKDLLGFFVGDKDKKPNQVVVIETGNPPLRLLGFVTRDHFDDLPDGIGTEGDVAVYLPMGYQLGGYTVMVSRDHVKPIDMNTEQALRFCVTAGMTGPKQDELKNGKAQVT
jgi:uncharacterized membrane protein